MLSSNNQKEQQRQMTANPNRFSLRKLSVGVCSLVVGFTFMGMMAHADQVSPSEVTTNQAVVQTTNNEKSDQQQSTNPQTIDQNVNKNQTTTPVVNNDKATDNAAVKTPVKPAEQSTTTSANNSNQTVSQPATTSANDTQTDQVNVNDWTYTKQPDGITLTGFNGHIVNGKIVVPNTFDFIKAGVITDGQKVYLGGYFRRNTGNSNNIHDQYGSQANEFAISKNGNGKVYAEDDWGDAFNGTPYQVMDLTNLDVSGVTRASQMFAFSKVKQIIGLDHWDTSNITDMGSMFLACGGLKNVGDLSSWNVSKVTNMVSMFEGCSNLRTTGNLDDWDTANVGNMAHMFAYDGALVSVGNLSNWRLPNVQRTDMMFAYTGNLTNIGDLSKWDMSKDTDMSQMFDGASKLTNLGNLGEWNTGNVKNMQKMFNEARSLNTLGDLSNWDTSKVTDMQYMFNNDFKLQHVGLLNHWNTGNVTSMDHMFFNNTSLDRLDVSNWNTSKVTNMFYTFASDNLNTSLQSLGDLSKWDTGNVTTFNGTFSHLAAIKSLGDLSHWNTSKATDMQVMFYDMQNLESLDVSGWDVSNVWNMVMMFMDDHKLESLTGLANWNVSNVHAANAMFCRTGLRNIDIHGWNLSNDTDTRWMFAYGFNPTVIDMRGVKLPTRTNFSLLSFYSNKPMVVYSDEGSQLFSLNNAKLNNYNDWVGNVVINVTGHQNTNRLTLNEVNEQRSASGQEVIATLPMDFVFTDPIAVRNQMRTVTNQLAVNKLVHDKYGEGVNVSKDDFADDANALVPSLKNDFSKDVTDLVADNYNLHLINNSYTQRIVYKDKNGNTLNTVEFSDYLDNNNHATIKQQDLIKKINDNLPKGHEIVSGLPTGDLLIDGTTPNDILVVVQPVRSSAQVIYQDENGNTISSSTINGNVGQTVDLNLQVPAGYEAVGTLPTQYTFTDAANQQIIIRVKAIQTPDQPVDPDNPVDPHTPVDPDPQTPTDPATPQEPAQPIDTVTTLHHSDNNVTSHSTQPKLPQTGNDNETQSSLVGLAVGAVATSLGLTGLSKKKRHN
jgi:LPXTG-motif cell wall-anchored protein